MKTEFYFFVNYAMVSLFFKRDLARVYTSEYSTRGHGRMLSYVFGTRHIGRDDLRYVVQDLMKWCSAEERAVVYDKYINSAVRRHACDFASRAVACRDFDTVRHIIDRHHDHALHATILYDVCEVKHVPLAEHLLSLGTDPRGSFDLMCCVELESVAHMAVDLIRPDRLNVALLDACAGGLRLVAERLIQRGADDFTGAYITAFKYGKPEIANWLDAHHAIDWSYTLQHAEKMCLAISAQPLYEDDSDDPDLPMWQTLLQTAKERLGQN